MNQQHLQQPPTIAILGTNTVVENALSLLLEDIGYSTRILKEPSAANPTGEQLLEGVDVLLLTPSLHEDHKDGFLKAIEAPAPAAGDVPVVLTLSTAPQEELNDRTDDNLVPWPTPLENLRRAVETALAPALAVSTAEVEG